MRNKKSDRILYTNKKTGEFVVSKRFNSHDYILSSIFDDEDDDLLHDGQDMLTESLLDEIDDDEWDDYLDDEDEVSIAAGDIMYTILGKEIIVYMSPDKLTNAFVKYMRNIIRINDEYVSDYERHYIQEFVTRNEQYNTCQIYFNDVVLRDGKLMFILGGEDRKSGCILIQYSDEKCTKVNFIIYPDEDDMFSYTKKFACISYEHYKNCNPEENLTLKDPKVYYTNLARLVIPMFNAHGINITLTSLNNPIAFNRSIGNRRGYSATFHDIKDSSFVKNNMSPVALYSPERNTDINIFVSAVSDYVNSGDIDSNNIFTNKWVIIGKCDKLYKYITARQTLVHPDDVVKMQWLNVNGIKKTRKCAMAMPLSMFMFYLPIFYMMFIDDVPMK